jgi:hypothetical protein
MLLLNNGESLVKTDQLNSYLINTYRILVAQDVEYLRCVIVCGNNRRFGSSPRLKLWSVYNAVQFSDYTQLAIWLELFYYFYKKASTKSSFSPVLAFSRC